MDDSGSSGGWSSGRQVAFLRADWGVLAGSLVGGALIVRFGQRFFPMPHGLGWEAGLNNTIFLWVRPRPPDVMWRDHREIGHAWTVGLLGDLLAYVDAAQVVTLVSLVGIVLAACLLARWLGHGGWPALVAGGVAGAMPVVRSAPGWANTYPLAAAVMAACLVAGVACLASGRARWALGGGALAAAALAMDQRGLGASALCAGLVLCAGLAGPGIRRRLWLLVAFIVPFAAVSGARAAVEDRAQVRTTSLLELAGVSGNENLTIIESECVDARDSGLARLVSPCGEATRRRGLRESIQHGVPPPAFVVPLLLLVLLPGRRGWRDSVGALGALGGSAVIVWGSMGMVPSSDRHILLSAAAIAALPAVAAGRLHHTATRVFCLVPPLSRRAWLAQGLAGVVTIVAAGGLLWWSGWTELSASPEPWYQRWEQVPERLPPRNDTANWLLASWVRQQAEPTATLVDCAGVGLLELASPHGGWILRPRGGPTCSPDVLAQVPPGPAWVIAFPALGLGDQDGWEMVETGLGSDRIGARQVFHRPARAP